MNIVGYNGLICASDIGLCVPVFSVQTGSSSNLVQIILSWKERKHSVSSVFFCKFS
jgi:hypothetical protein